MKRNIIKAEIIDSDRLHELMQRSDAAGLSRFIPQALLYFGTSAALVLVPFDNLAVFIPILVVNAVIQFGMFGMLHESCHQTAFKSRNWNLLAGWVAALAQPMTPALMRAFHFEHHRHTHDVERDPELGRLPFMLKWPKPVMWVITLTGLPFIIARFGWSLFAAIVPPSDVWNKVLYFVKPAKRRRIAWEARGLVLLHAGLMTAAVLWVPSIWWIYVGMFAGHAMLGYYTTCEHRGLDAGGTILERTRSLKTPGFVRWLIWNMPYHAEHHAWPAVPFHNLGKLHEEIKDHLVHRESPLYLHTHGGRERAQAS